MLSLRKLCCGFQCSLCTLLALILRLALMFASIGLAANSLSLENKGETQLASRPCRASVNFSACRGGWRRCRAAVLADGPDLTQLLLLCKLGALSSRAIIYCLKLLWSGSQEVAIKVVILGDKLRHKRKKFK